MSKFKPIDITIESEYEYSHLVAILSDALDIEEPKYMKAKSYDFAKAFIDNLKFARNQ